MKNKLFLCSILIVSGFMLSGCALKDKFELKVLNKINNKVDQKIQKTETKVETEEDILKQLEAETETNLDSEFKVLNTEE
jgi:hypothetical protein